MPLLPSAANFTGTAYKLDKIVHEDTKQYSITSTGTDQLKTEPNPFGAKALPTLAWSVDNVNFYPAGASVAGTNPYTANIAVDATTIYLYFYNNSGSTQTFYVHYTLDTIE